MHYDVFNGDADGIIALVQLRLAEPKDAVLVTGVKRDISLVKQVPAAKASSVTVLDISMEKNATALQELLEQGVDVLYVDHHRAGSIPEHEKLDAIIDTDANTCTSLLVNKRLNNRYANWAISAAYGDNMIASAEQLANEHNLSTDEKEQLKALGVYVNYNGYGSSVSDLHFTPEDLFNALVQYEDPLTLINAQDSVFHQLSSAYHKDMALAQQGAVLFDDNVCKVVALPEQAWARRVSGVFGNELANQSPEKAHAVLTINQDKSYTVSLRAPLNNKQGAGDICAEFPTGGGRAAAAGVNQLPQKQVNSFIEAVVNYYSK